MSAPVSIPAGDAAPLSGLWLSPSKVSACLVLAHGAGAGMGHRAMAATAEGLAERGVATLRFNFPYMDAGRARVDPPELAQHAVRAAVAHASVLEPETPLFAGGRSFGGRMTSGAQAAAPLPNVRGLVFFAFPLHAAGKPAITRAAHLSDVAIPMLFLSGDRDALAEIALLQGVAERLGPRATLHVEPFADHSFHAPAKSGRKDPDILASVLDAAAAWMTP